MDSCTTHLQMQKTEVIKNSKFELPLTMKVDHGCLFLGIYLFVFHDINEGLSPNLVHSEQSF